MEITINAPKALGGIVNADGTKGRTIALIFNLGEDLRKAVELNSEAVVYSLYKAKGIIVFQDTARRMLAASKEDGSPVFSDEDIVKWASTYKLGIVKPGGRRGTRKTAEVKLLEGLDDPDMVKKMDPATLKAIQRKLRELTAAR